MNTNIVSTIRQRCKRCYSCIRECPAKAIRVLNGQAVVLYERCISCGHCLKVCSQHAKQIQGDAEKTIEEILSFDKTIAIVAPSFAASFPGIYSKIPTALKKMGFSIAAETAFGADLVSQLYLNEIEKAGGKTIISTACPAVYNYVEKYHEELVPNLAKIVSPMIAMGRYMKSEFGPQVKIVFIGPCIAKKSEFQDEEVSDAIDAVITFVELKQIFRTKNIIIEELEDSEFDPPHALMGKTFPLAGGLLKTSNIPSDILEKEILVVEGKDKVIEIINEIKNNSINAKIVDILFCEGCISGPAIDSDLNYYSKRETVIKYINEKINLTDKQIWKSNIYNSRKLYLKREFQYKDQRRPSPSQEKIKEILAKSNKLSVEDELNCTACGYKTCKEYAEAIAKGLAEEEMCLPYLIEKLESAYEELKSTQEQLHSAEKLASIGQLAAGVAHEINNPLGTILLYSSMLGKQVAKYPDGTQHVEDLNLIIEETKRCKNIVADLLNFARQGKLKVTKFNVFQTISKIIKTVSANPIFQDIKVSIKDETDQPNIEADADQMKEVLLNIINNACESFDENKNKNIDIRIYKDEDHLYIDVKDNGCGIPKENYGKVFTPFFTTKKMGKGTGLGLAIVYGIIKMHRGDIKFQSNVGEGSIFTIKLPIKLNNSQTYMNFKELE